MGRARDHFPRVDASSVCPDQAACERLYHPTLQGGDCCECCGAEIDGHDAPAPQAGALARVSALLDVDGPAPGRLSRI